MARKPNYLIESQSREKVVLRDLGPWDIYPTITNAPEDVVAELVSRGVLQEGARLFYTDSDGMFDELLVRDGQFAGYAPAERAEH